MAEVDEQELFRRKFVEFEKESIKNTSSSLYPGVWPGEEHGWSKEQFSNTLKIQFHEATTYDITFSLVGVDAAIANAFRRILLAEISTLAIENVYFLNNTSVIQDEVLAHRLGMIPFTGKKTGLEFIKWVWKGDPKNGVEGSRLCDYNAMMLQLDVECIWHPEGKERFRKGERDPNKLYVNSNVYARQIKWVPTERQEKHFGDSDEDAFRPVHPDILIAKLRPGQAIKCNMHVFRGIGADHAKFSPVATAFYRLMPAITITKPIVGMDAKKFARCFPRGVITLHPVTSEQAAQEGSGYEGHEGELHAVVTDPMKDTVSRECLRHDEFKGKVKLGRIQDHFIFKVESTGQIQSEELFVEAVKVLKLKCQKLKAAMNEMPST